MDDELWEREKELSSLDAALSATSRAEGQLMVIEGPAGVGKSRLMLAARRKAEACGLLVLAGRGMELERGVPFGLARQLFVPPLARAPAEERARLLAGPAALAGPLLGEVLAPDASLGEGQAGALVEGLYWLTVNLAHAAEEASGLPGLVLVVDDAQWADRPSLRFLVRAVSQIEEVALCVLLAERTGEPGTPTDLLSRLRGHPGSQRLQPAALSAQAVGAFVRSQGFPDAEDEFCSACAHVSGGNPLLLRELLAVLVADGVVPSARAADRVAELLPDSVLSAVVVNLGRLPTEAADLACAVAILDAAPLPLAAELAGLDLTVAEDAADVLTSAQLLAAGEPLSFVHPLIAAAVLADQPPRSRARAHERAARLLEAAGADVGRVAAHLLHTRPRADPWASAVLLAAGIESLVRGEPRGAVRLLRRSLEEPPPEDQRAATLIELAQAEAADDSPDAVDRLVEALNGVHDPQARADAYNQLARLLFFKGDISQSGDAAEHGLAELGADDPMTSRLLSAQLTAATFDPKRRPVVTDRLAGHLAAARAGQTPDDPLICAHLSARMAISADPASLVRPIAEGAFAHHPLVDETAHGVVLAFPIVALLFIDELDRAQAFLERALGSDRARTSLITLTVAHHWMAVVDYRRGDLVDAQAHDQRALAACGSEDWELYGAWIAANLAQVWVERGDMEAARAALGADDEDAVDPIGRCLKLEARGRVAMADNDARAALEHFTAAGRAFDTMGLVSPGFIPWRSLAALPALRLGQHEQAARFVEEELALARLVGGPRTVGIALRAAGLVAPEERRIALLTESCESLARSAARLEHARSLVDLGAALRRDGQRVSARQPLRQALEIAARSGADPLLHRARDELATAGGRPRRVHLTGVDSLTPTERRIAELAAQGRTNAQISQDLYVTSKTVEWHLGNVFRKLDVSNRSQLPGRAGIQDGLSI